MDTLKFSARLACQTRRTFVMKNVPRLPWSDERFQTPCTLLYICSLGSRIRLLFLMMAPRNLRSRYNRLVSYAVYTACTVVNSRGDWRTRLVKTNSNRELLYFVITKSACVLPRSRELAFRMLIDATAEYPIDRLIREFRWHTQISRRLVIDSEPFSPLLPFVSSTELIESICTSPERMLRCDSAVSRMSLSPLRLLLWTAWTLPR